MANKVDLITIQGNQIISETYNNINANFEKMANILNEIDIDSKRNFYNIKSLSWKTNTNSDNLIAKIELEGRTDTINSPSIPLAGDTPGIVSINDQTFKGNKTFKNSIILSNEGIKGINDRDIITQDNKFVYIGGKNDNSIKLEYDKEGNLIGTYVDDNLFKSTIEESVGELQKQYADSLEKMFNTLNKQVDKTITVWEYKNEQEITGYETYEDENDNIKSYKPWDSDDDNSLHQQDILLTYSDERDNTWNNIYWKDSNWKAYIYTRNSLGDLLWKLVDESNSFASMAIKVKEIDKKAGDLDGQRNFFTCTRKQMNDGDTISQHKVGDIWIVADDNGEDCPIDYKDFQVGGFYMCQLEDNNKPHKKHTDNWTLLVDFDSIFEKKIEDEENLKKIRNGLYVVDNILSDYIISSYEKNQLRNEWKRITGLDGTSSIQPEIKYYRDLETDSDSDDILIKTDIYSIYDMIGIISNEKKGNYDIDNVDRDLFDETDGIIIKLYKILFVNENGAKLDSNEIVTLKNVSYTNAIYTAFNNFYQYYNKIYNLAFGDLKNNIDEVNKTISELGNTVGNELSKLTERIVSTESFISGIGDGVQTIWFRNGTINIGGTDYDDTPYPRLDENSNITEGNYMASDNIGRLPWSETYGDKKEDGSIKRNDNGFIVVTGENINKKREIDKKHIGDIYVYLKKDDKTKRGVWIYDDDDALKEGDSWRGGWKELPENDVRYPAVAASLFEAADASIAADGAINVFYTMPLNGYSVGDMWIISSEDANNQRKPTGAQEGELWYAIEDNESYDKSHWKKTKSDGSGLTKDQTNVVDSFKFEEDVMEDGATETFGGLNIMNLLYLKDFNGSEDTEGVITGGLSGIRNDNTGLFLGSDYHNAYKAANPTQQKNPETERYFTSTKEYIEYYKKHNDDNSVKIPPVLLTKDGFNSVIGGCYFSDDDKLMVPVTNIDGEIKCKSLKADNDSENPNDAEATVTSNSFKIKYGNAYIEISLINGVPTLIGVNKEGKTSWSLGEIDRDNSMCNILYNPIFGDINYVKAAEIASYESIILDRVASQIDTNLPICTIVNKYPLYLKDSDSYKISPLKTNMKYKIGNKVKYFSYNITQECPYYFDFEDFILGYAYKLKSEEYYSILCCIPMSEVSTYIKSKYGIDVSATQLDSDIAKAKIHEEKYKIYVIDRSFKNYEYMKYIVEYIKNDITYYNDIKYNYVDILSSIGALDNFLSPGDTKDFKFHGDFIEVQEVENIVNKFDYFLKKYTNNSNIGKYDVKIYNQDGYDRSIVACNPQKEVNGDEYSPNYIIKRDNDKWDTYLEKYCNDNGINPILFNNNENYGYYNCNLAVFELQDGLPSPRNISELSWNSWWYSIDSIRDCVDKNTESGSNKIFDDYYPRIFDISSEIEILDTGDFEYNYDSITLTKKIQKYNVDILYNVINYENKNATVFNRYYTDLKLLSFDYNNSNIISYNTDEVYPNYKVSITESISGDIYTYVYNNGEKIFLLNDEVIDSDSLPEELKYIFMAYKDSSPILTTKFKIKKIVSNNTCEIEEDTGIISLDGENNTTSEENIHVELIISLDYYPVAENSYVWFDALTTYIDISKTIILKRNFKDQKLTMYQSMEGDPSMPEYTPKNEK